MSSTWEQVVAPLLRRYLPLLARRRKIRKAVDYAIQVGDHYLSLAQGAGVVLRGSLVAEIGPGFQFGHALMLMGHGARMVLIDKYLAAWDPEFHPWYYRALRRALGRSHPALDFSALDAVISSSSHEIAQLQLLRVPLEEAAERFSGEVDVTFSNAVFEHLYDPSRAILNLSRISRPGALGFHQIDFRDHRDFSRPLEYLTLEDAAFASLFDAQQARCGNRNRIDTFERAFSEQGFDIVAKLDNCLADERYLQEVRPRMLPRYRAMDLAVLRILGAQFTVRRR